MRLLILDNYDSFTYNLYHYLVGYFEETVVFKNDEAGAEIGESFDKIVLSPGPGLPSEAGIMPELIARWKGEKSILGVCLGMQGIAEHFGAKLVNLSTVMHGVESIISIKPEVDEVLFEGLPKQFAAGHYHSWVVDPQSLPGELVATSFTENGLLMSLRHIQFDIAGVQFHPESVMTPWGRTMLANWAQSNQLK